MNYAVILAGGVGSRFWPLSRRCRPKQFLSLCSQRSSLQQAIERVLPLTTARNVFIATNKSYAKEIKALAREKGIPLGNLLFEPEARNTLAPVAVLSSRIHQKDQSAVIAVVPADQYVDSKSGFLSSLRQAIKAAALGCVITLGIRPIRPETGFGYIKTAKEKTRIKGLYKVERFIEKPQWKKAVEFQKQRSFYWNAGIFVFRAEVMLKEIERHAPEVYRLISRLNSNKNCAKLWRRFPCLSLDYGVMEKSKNICLLPARFGWVDLGSFLALERFFRKDKNGNILKGKCLDLASKNTFVWSKDRLTATVGLRDMIVIDTKDALLVCAKDSCQQVRKVVQALKEKGLEGLT